MGLKVKFNASELSARIETIKGAVVKNAMKALEKSGEQIAETASAFAPRDTGALESAFRVARVGQDRDALGRFQRASVTVYVDPYAENPDSGELVTRYSEIMHEELTPYGDMKLGKGSIAKGGQVGGGFLERAIEAHIDEIEETAANQVKGALLR